MSGTVELASTDHKEIRLLDGRRLEFDLRGSNILASDIRNHHIDFNWYRPGVVWHQSLRSILVGLLSTHSLIYADRCAYYCGRFASDVDSRHEKPRAIGLDHFEQWPTDYGVASWAFMQAVLGHWIDAKLPGIQSDIAAFLSSPNKWEEKGNGWYFALVANDPQRGAFTWQELKSIQTAIDRAYERGRLGLREWALAWFLIGTGVRPIQIARMTVGDVLVNDGPEGKEVTLCIPLAKGENAIVKERWKRKAPTVLAEVLLRYLEKHHSKSRESEPLFADRSDKIGSELSYIFNGLETYSERLRGSFPIFPYRFRYTLGTRALALGASDHEVARLLTHRTTFCVQFYRAAMPMLQKPIRDAIGLEMSLFAQAFQGRLIDNLEQATRRGDASALIRDFAHLLGQQIGACGTKAECHQDAPRACLGCRKFEPFRGAPWEELLKILIADLEKETEERIRLITFEQIEAVRYIIAERDGLVGEVA